MNTIQIVEVVKKVITDELLENVDGRHCVLDLCIEDYQNVEKLSKVSKSFLECNKDVLAKVYNSEKRLALRKYGYEKILNQYLEEEYGVHDIGSKFTSAVERIQETEERRHDEKVNNEILERDPDTTVNIIDNEQPLSVIDDGTSAHVETKNSDAIDDATVNVEDAAKKSAKDKKEERKRQRAEEKILYQAVTETKERYTEILVKKYRIKREMIEYYAEHYQNQCKYLKKNKKISCQFQNKPCTVYFAACPYNQKFFNKIKRELKRKLQFKQKSIPAIAQENNVTEQCVRDISQDIKRRCPYYRNGKCLFERMAFFNCTLQFDKCAFHNEFSTYLKKQSKKSVQKRKKNNSQIKTIYAIAKEYNTTVPDVNTIAAKLRVQCSYYNKQQCFYEKRVSFECSLQNTDCILHNKFISRLKQQSEENLQKQKKVNSQAKADVKRVTTKNEPVSREIGLKDFVVRTSVFKCMHNKHNIDNVVALINIDNDGKRQQVRVSAGYCSQCKVYFILDSTYRNLKSKGIILCRVTDEKSYMKSGYMNGMQLARESLLMQYGYNVSQTEGLTTTRRQKILAVIIDNKVMSKSEIISYLDFFINQRSSMSRMEVAISKWEADREFVEYYKIGQYTQFGVSAIYRR